MDQTDKRMDVRFMAVDKRFDEMDKRFSQTEGASKPSICSCCYRLSNWSEPIAISRIAATHCIEEDPLNRSRNRASFAGANREPFHLPDRRHFSSRPGKEGFVRRH